MNARYARYVIRDQIDRAESLKAGIPRRRRHAALERLAAACRMTLGGGGQSRLLGRAASLLDSAGGGGVAAEGLRDCAWAVGSVVALPVTGHVHTMQWLARRAEDGG